MLRVALYGAGDDVGGLGEQVAGDVQGDGEAAAVGVGAADGLGGVGDRDAQGLVAGQQGVDLLGDTGRGHGRLRKIVSAWKKSQASRPFA